MCIVSLVSIYYNKRETADVPCSITVSLTALVETLWGLFCGRSFCFVLMVIISLFIISRMLCQRGVLWCTFCFGKSFYMLISSVCGCFRRVALCLLSSSLGPRLGFGKSLTGLFHLPHESICWRREDQHCYCCYYSSGSFLFHLNGHKTKWNCAGYVRSFFKMKHLAGRLVLAQVQSSRSSQFSQSQVMDLGDGPHQL